MVYNIVSNEFPWSCVPYIYRCVVHMRELTLSACRLQNPIVIYYEILIRNVFFFFFVKNLNAHTHTRKYEQWPIIHEQSNNYDIRYILIYIILQSCKENILAPQSGVKRTWDNIILYILLQSEPIRTWPTILGHCGCRFQSWRRFVYVSVSL